MNESGYAGLIIYAATPRLDSRLRPSASARMTAVCYFTILLFVILTKIPRFVILVEMNESGYAGLIIYAATPRLDSRLRPSASARMTAVCYFTILLFVILTKIPQFVILAEMNESGYAGLIIYAATPRLDSRLRPSASARMTATCYFTILLFVILTKIPHFVILVEMNESGYAGLIIYAATPRLDSRLRPSASARMTAVCYFTILLFVILTKIPQFVILVEMNESGYAGLIIYAATPRLDSRLRPSASARMTAVCYFTILLFVILTKIPQFVILVEMNESGYAGLIIYAATPRLDSRLRPSASARMTAVCYFTVLLFVILTKIPQFVILAGRRGSSYGYVVTRSVTQPRRKPRYFGGVAAGCVQLRRTHILTGFPLRYIYSSLPPSAEMMNSSGENDGCLLFHHSTIRHSYKNPPPRHPRRNE